MATMKTIEIWVVVDENGDYAVGTTLTAAGESFDAEIGFDNEVGTRRIKMTVKVPLPEPIELTGEVTADEQPGELRVA